MATLRFGLRPSRRWPVDVRRWGRTPHGTSRSCARTSGRWPIGSRLGTASRKSLPARLAFGVVASVSGRCTISSSSASSRQPVWPSDRFTPFARAIEVDMALVHRRKRVRYEVVLLVSALLAFTRMHGRAGLQAAEGLRIGELAGDRGPAGQHRIGHVPGLVDGLQRSGPGPPHRAGLPGEPLAPDRPVCASCRPAPSWGSRSGTSSRRRSRPSGPSSTSGRATGPPSAAFVGGGSSSNTGNPRSGSRPAGSSTSGEGSGAASNRPTPACWPRSPTTTTRW